MSSWLIGELVHILPRQALAAVSLTSNRTMNCTSHAEVVIVDPVGRFFAEVDCTCLGELQTRSKSWDCMAMLDFVFHVGRVSQTQHSKTTLSIQIVRTPVA
ncbi:hypothetical protein Ae201684P_022223 [Aphanomyces euteiches]|uniref:Secreted protein n=1 Tax=Aphanomyces euteiches TaxID=100861 RepID=A0A6G0X6Q0_9STRA|nr:hypothetical protein Ae201684_007959 [Aphanomyces euteiches]KAH9074416.1 hypothetical protein Ae201684P_022223 [Aphanomyces euteiches]